MRLLSAIVFSMHTNANSCRWHDKRHTFISRLGENMVSDQTLMAITGHLSKKMLERYSHARMESKRAAVRTLDFSSGRNDSPKKSPRSEGEIEQIVM
jgi:hypothetical protein